MMSGVGHVGCCGWLKEFGCGLICCKDFFNDLKKFNFEFCLYQVIRFLIKVCKNYEKVNFSEIKYALNLADI